MTGSLPGSATPLLEAALMYPSRLGPVFPLRERDKLPAFKGSFHDATSNRVVITRLWRAKTYNIGVPNGAVSGTTVLDVDVKHGVDGGTTLKVLEAKHGPLPETL